MAYRVVWSPAGLDDLDALGAYIARDSRRYASAVVRRLLDTARNLRHLPFSGRIVPEIGDPLLREKLVYGWRLIYRVKNDLIIVGAIVHTRQSFESGIGRIMRS